MEGNNHQQLMATVAETKATTRLSHSTVCKMLREGRLKSIKIDGRRLVYMSSIKELLQLKQCCPTYNDPTF